MLRKPCTFALILLISTLSSFAQADKTLSFSLDEAVKFALENNISGKNSDLDAEINKKRILEIITTGLPQIDSKVTYKDNLKLPVTVVPANKFPSVTQELELEFGTKHNMNADLTITQLIADGRYFIGLKATKTMTAMSEQQTKLTDVEIRANVTRAYYSVLVAQEGQTIVKKNLETLTKLHSDVSETYKEGLSEELDVDRLAFQLSNMQTIGRKIDLQLDLAKNMLKYHMGVDYSVDIVLSDNLDAVLLANTLNADTTFNYEARPEYRLLGLQYNMRGYDAQRIRAAYFPALVAFGGYGWNAQRNEFDVFDFNKKWFNTAYLGLELHVPIFDSYHNGAVYQQKKLEQQKIMNQINDFKQSSNLQVTQTRTEYKTALDEYKNQQNNLQLADKIYNKVATMYQEGVGSSFELADAESSKTEAQRNYLNAMYDLLTKKVELEKALGNY